VRILCLYFSNLAKLSECTKRMSIRSRHFLGFRIAEEESAFDGSPGGAMAWVKGKQAKARGRRI
jgi:hypothetical protein